MTNEQLFQIVKENVSSFKNIVNSSDGTFDYVIVRRIAGKVTVTACPAENPNSAIVSTETLRKLVDEAEQATTSRVKVVRFPRGYKVTVDGECAAIFLISGTLSEEHACAYAEATAETHASALSCKVTKANF